MQALKKMKSENPLILIDEIDELGKDSDRRYFLRRLSTRRMVLEKEKQEKA